MSDTLPVVTIIRDGVPVRINASDYNPTEHVLAGQAVPAPVASTAPEPAPKAGKGGKAAPVASTAPEPAPVASTAPEPAPVASTAPEPAPVASTVDFRVAPNGLWFAFEGDNVVSQGYATRDLLEAAISAAGSK